MHVARVPAPGPHLHGASALRLVAAHHPVRHLAVHALHPAARYRVARRAVVLGLARIRLRLGTVTGASGDATLAALRHEDGGSPRLRNLVREALHIAIVVGTGVVGAPLVAKAVRAVLHRGELGGVRVDLETNRLRDEAWIDDPVCIVAEAGRLAGAQLRNGEARMTQWMSTSVG